MYSPWSPNSWKNLTASQQPKWPCSDMLKSAVDQLAFLPALVFSAESRLLKAEIGGISQGTNFILQAGNCAERFSDCNGSQIHNFLRIYHQMTMIIGTMSRLKIVPIGRVAGQYAKPRSAETEVINGKELTSYRGDNVNAPGANMDHRKPDPNRMVEGYFRSAATLNLIRAFLAGDYSSIENLNDWQQHLFWKDVADNAAYLDFFNELGCPGMLGTKSLCYPASPASNFFCSHEGLLLDYEAAFARIDTINGGYYSTSAHFLWIGERTRQLNGAHVEFFRGINNPIGVKIGPSASINDLLRLVEILNPENEPGRLSVIVRFGKDLILERLPKMMAEITNSGFSIQWICDPMHGNTFVHNGFKVRALGDIKEELNHFFAVAKSVGCMPGGVHLELTAENVTECVGGITGLSFNDVPKSYLTSVDPRLNAAQAVEISLHIGKLLREFHATD